MHDACPKDDVRVIAKHLDDGHRTTANELLDVCWNERLRQDPRFKKMVEDANLPVRNGVEVKTLLAAEKAKAEFYEDVLDAENPNGKCKLQLLRYPDNLPELTDLVMDIRITGLDCPNK